MTTIAQASRVLAVPASDSHVAERHFRARLALETDPSDVHADLMAGIPGLVIVDVRSGAAYAQGHVPGAVHCPHVDIPTRARVLIPAGATVVVYCWWPGCNGANRAGAAFASLGIGVKEMIGGFEWWAREGLPVEDAAGTRRPDPDPLVAVVSA